MKGSIGAVPTSVLQSSKIVSFCIRRQCIKHDNMQSTSDVSLVSMQEGVVFPQNSGVSIQQWSGDYFKIFERMK